MKLLHPTDFSATSKAVCELASQLTDRMNATLTVCHVYGPTGALPLGYLSAPVSRVVPTSQEIDFHYRMQTHGRNKHSEYRLQLLRRLDSFAPAGVQKDLLIGEVVGQIEKAAQNHDLLIMSWGGTTRQVLQRSRTPVLCVSPEATRCSIEQVVIGIDFSRSSSNALEWCRRLQRLGAELVLAHVGAPHPENERRLEIMAAEAQALPIWRTGSVAEELSSVADVQGADVIAIGGKSRPAFLEALLRGTQRSLLDGGSKALLIVPG